MNMKNLLRISDLSKRQITRILSRAGQLKRGKKSNILKDKIIASLFFEPSTRTRLSFETAVLKLSGKIIGFSEPSGTSLNKGESFNDTIKVIAQFADLLIIRHPQPHAVENISKNISKPIINAGDGDNEHPTQTLLDLFAILETQKKLKNLEIAIVGDLKFGRVPHSLAQALQLFNNNIYLVSPKSLKMPKEYLKNIKYIKTDRLHSIIPQMDIIYMTRIQKERFKNMAEYNKIKNYFVLKASDLKNAKNNLKILHALPRINEIARDVDDTKYAYYFEQVKNGVFIRMALLELMMK